MWEYTHSWRARLTSLGENDGVGARLLLEIFAFGTIALGTLALGIFALGTLALGTLVLGTLLLDVMDTFWMISAQCAAH